MKVFLIVLAVIVLITALILAISAEFTIIFDNGWSTKIRVLFIEKDIQLSKLLSFIIAPDKAGKEAAEKSKKKKKEKDAPPVEEAEQSLEEQPVVEETVEETPEESVTEELPVHEKAKKE
ncbi:MAG: hypothetical protein IKS12_04450, partial [Eubacterium sp.]|nr:hypothetical protein [Eubacterium sp.]